jgi:hypothetical protein
VLAAQVSGCATAADPEPLDVDAYRAALIAGRTTYDVITRAGRPWKLRTRGPSVTASRDAIVAAHACGAAGRDAADVTELPEDPRQARASGTGRQGPRSAFAQPRTGYDLRNPASAATQRRSDLSDRPHRCQTCRRLIGPDEPFWAIDHERQRWAQHDECP